MRIGIAVFDKNWIDATPLFTFLKAFGVTIKSQATYGEDIHAIQGTHLVIDGNIATWVNLKEFEEFVNKDFTNLIHYDSLIYNIKRNSHVQH